MSNFVFPTILNMIMIIAVFRSGNPLLPTDILFVNLYIEIVSVLLATIWCSSRFWERDPAKAATKVDHVVQALDPEALTLSSLPQDHSKSALIGEK